MNKKQNCLRMKGQQTKTEKKEKATKIKKINGKCERETEKRHC